MTAGVGPNGVRYVSTHGPVTVRVRDAGDRFLVEWRAAYDNKSRRPYRTYGKPHSVYEFAREAADDLMARLKEGGDDGART